MKREHAYLTLAILGAVAPWIGFARFFATHGFAGDFVGALFANGASAGFTADLLISSLVFWIFLFERAARQRLDRPWLFIAVNLLVGLSCALPLALWRIERLARSGSRRADRAAAGAPVSHASSIALLLAATLAILIAAPVRAEKPGTDPAAVIDRFFDAYRSADLDRMLAMYDPGAVFIDVAQRHRYEGTDELAAFLRSLIGIHLSMDVDVKRRVVSGDQVVVQHAYTGSLSGEALHAATGKDSCRDTEYAIPVTSWFEIRDGRIVSQTDFIDLATLAEVRLRASGATP